MSSRRQRRRGSETNTVEAVHSDDTDQAHTSPAPTAQHLKDAGNKPSDHYRSRLSPARYAVRSWCLPIVRRETEILAALQNKYRTPWLDVYFAWTANLASHTFYVLMLPPLFWFGASTMGRDLVFVLGMGIYLLGFCKDLLCLPRPRSPPLARITMLTYTTQEYGWPSSHSANATAVTLTLLFKVFDTRDSWAPLHFWAVVCGLVIYYVSLITGRLYCGMHGFFDIITGSILGVVLFVFRRLYGEAYDNWLLASARNETWLGIVFTVLLIIGAHLFLIHIHPEPVDNCPCFDDSVAFIGVLIGLDLSHYACVLTKYFEKGNSYGDLLLIPYNPDCSLLVLAARFALGVSLVVVWKSILKPVVFSILPPIYKYIGVNLPRSNFMSTAHSHQSNRQIRRQSISNMELTSEIDSVLKAINSSETVKVGPESDIDAYELLDYQASHPSSEVPVTISGVFRPRYDVEIIGRCIIYAGISTMTVWGLGLSAEYLRLF